tara:strand:+ start:4221 stop:4502 length:282 start_codon:yes stop_codon:yes gene_type:complete
MWKGTIETVNTDNLTVTVAYYSDDERACKKAYQAVGKTADEVSALISQEIANLNAGDALSIALAPLVGKADIEAEFTQLKSEDSAPVLDTPAV